MLTETSPLQDKLTAFSASTAMPPDADVGNTRKPPPEPQLTSENSLALTANLGNSG